MKILIIFEKYVTLLLSVPIIVLIHPIGSVGIFDLQLLILFDDDLLLFKFLVPLHLLYGCAVQKLGGSLIFVDGML